MRRWLAVVVGSLVLLAPAACSRSPAAGSPSLSPSPFLSPATVGGTPGSTVPPSAPPPSTGVPSGTLLRGTAQPSEQKGCFIFVADDHRIYLLLGGDRSLIEAGGQLEVVGQAVPGLAGTTTCRQGIPFQVASARRI